MSLFTSKQRAIHISVFGKTDVGRTRDHNEDAFLVADLSKKNASLQPEVREHQLGPKGTLLVVCDGIGGHAAGEVASEMGTQAIYQHLSTEWGNDEESTPQQFAYRMKEAVELANASIHTYAKEHPETRGMGTTVTAVGILESSVYVTQVGDSRGYLVRNGSAIQITKDQSLMQRLIDAGELTEEEAERSERRNIILQALGPEAKVRVDLTHQEVRRGDAIVLCSDGLSGQVKKDEIAKAVSSSTDLVQVCSDLIALANERGGPDNITVIVARVGGDGVAEPDGGEPVGHQIYPLLDPESTTEPVPIYRGSPPPQPRGSAHAMLAAFTSVATRFFAGLLIVAHL